MRTLLVWLCLLCAAVATAADFTVVHAPNPGETPLPIPQNELRAEWRFERHWPPFRLIQGPQWDLVLVAGRPLSLAFRKNRPEHALFPGSEMTCSVVEARRVSLWRDAEGRLRSLALPPRPIGYPKGTLICLGQYTGCLPFALCGDTDLLPLEDRAFLPFWLNALLGHPAAKLRDRDPWELPDPRLYVRAQLRLAPKALGLPEDVPLDTLIQTLKARRAEFDPPPVPEGLFAVSRQGDDHLIFSFTNVTDAPLTVHSLPSVTLCNSRRAFLDSSRGCGPLHARARGTPRPPLPVGRQGLPERNRHAHLLRARHAGRRTSRPPPPAHRDSRPLGRRAVAARRCAGPHPHPDPAAGRASRRGRLPPCPRLQGHEALRSCGRAFPDLLRRRANPRRARAGGVRRGRLPRGVGLSLGPLLPACPGRRLRHRHLGGPARRRPQGLPHPLAARTYPTADPDTVREALREYYEGWPRPAEPFVPDTPTTLVFAQKYAFSPDSLPAIAPAWIRLTLEGECLTLTLANPSEAPLTVEAGKFFLWETDDVFRLDGRLVRSPLRNAMGEPLAIPRLILGPGESKTLRWRVTGLAPGKCDRMLYVEAPMLVDGKPACVFRAEIPLLDFSGEPLFFGPLPPENCEIIQERERVEPARFPRKVLFEKRIPEHAGVSALGVSDPCPAGRPRGRV